MCDFSVKLRIYLRISATQAFFSLFLWNKTANMKILFVGDASNMHNTLAHALRDMGHTCVVASNGSGWQQTERDINIERKSGAWGAIQYGFDILTVLPKMRNFDIVHFSNPHFYKLRPPKLQRLFSWLKSHNRHVFLSALATDHQYVKTCYDGKTFRYSDYLLGEEVSPYMLSEEGKHQSYWLTAQEKAYHDFFINNIDGAVACLYEYYVSYKDVLSGKLAYGGIPIDTNALQPHFLTSEPEKVRFFIGIQRDRTVLKGTDRLLVALKRVCERYPDRCEMRIAENVPYKEYVKMMHDSHVILDQIYSYTPATNALIAMAQGMIAVSGAEPEYYDFIGEQSCRPIINVSPLVTDDIYSKLEWLVLNKSHLPELSRMSREFVMKHNESHIVAQRHIDFWKTFTEK